MMPGTRPARRSVRAAPLPARGRAVALISLAVAMAQVLVITREWKKAAEAATNPRAYSAAWPKPQERRRQKTGSRMIVGSTDEASAKSGPRLPITPIWQSDRGQTCASDQAQQKSGSLTLNCSAAMGIQQIHRGARAQILNSQA